VPPEALGIDESLAEAVAYWWGVYDALDHLWLDFKLPTAFGIILQNSVRACPDDEAELTRAACCPRCSCAALSTWWLARTHSPTAGDWRHRHLGEVFAGERGTGSRCVGRLRRAPECPFNLCVR
jgi:hypothetical protein